MKSRIITVALTALLIMSVVGCPNDTQTGSSTSANNKITSLQTVIDKASDGDTINLSKYTDITDYNATVNKALTINGSSTSLNNAVLTVESSSTISGITNASVTASSALENGSLKISSSSLSSLTINGGGINSIELFDVTVDSVTIDKAASDNTNDQYIRLSVNDSTSITNLNVSSSALIDTAGSFNANDINITFGNDNADLNVAFRKTIELTTPTGKVKADFAMGETDNSADFYIIVNENAKIAENFYRQVSNKMADRPIDAAAMPLYHGEDKFDFTQPIAGDMSFRMNDLGQPEGETTQGSITADIPAYIIRLNDHDLTCDISGDDLTFALNDASGSGISYSNSIIWSYELSYGSHDVSGDYWTGDNNGKWSIGTNANSTNDAGVTVSVKTLPKEGIYQLTVYAKYDDYLASETFLLNIVQKNNQSGGN